MNLKKLSMTLASALLPMAAMAGNGVELEHLGVDNTLLRVTGDEKYLILPIQENVDDARVNVIVDNQIVKTFYARLAKSKTDYTVPFDLTPYRGHKVEMLIETPQGRSSVREAKGDVCWKTIGVSDTFDTTNREKYRPAYHHTPLYGWMNDPNGMFYKDGKWHLYYQHNPYGSKWQNMTWGHSVSPDLVNWEHLPLAIEPDGLGSIFSGSCVLDPENTVGYGNDAVIAMYTSAAKSQIQSLAGSRDGGMTFEKYDGNPVITLESEARDPNMFWNPDTKEWTLVLAHALDHEMLIFTSPDMKKWTLQSAFGKGLGAQEGVWECPDLFELPVEGSGKSKWVLICNINPGGPFGGSAAQYFVGDFDGRTFTADTGRDGKVHTKWMDYGKDHYATVSWSDAPDDRRVVIGWMSNWEYAADVPTMQFRSANTLPRELGLFKGADGETYLASKPAAELSALRGKLMVDAGRTQLGVTPVDFTLSPESEGLCEIVADFDARKNSKVTFTLSNAAGEKVVMTYDAAARTMSMDRTAAGVSDFSGNFPAVTVAPTRENKGRVSLRIFVDRSSVELFGNDGRFVMTNLVFPNAPYLDLSVSATDGGARLNSLKIYSIKH